MDYDLMTLDELIAEANRLGINIEQLREAVKPRKLTPWDVRLALAAGRVG